MLVCLMVWQKHQYFLKKVPLLKIMNDNVHIIQLNGWWLLRFLIAYGSPNHYTSWFGFGLFKNCMHLKTVQMSVFAIKVNINPIIRIFLNPQVCKIKSLDFFTIFLTNRVWPNQAKSWKWVMFKTLLCQPTWFQMNVWYTGCLTLKWWKLNGSEGG